jgi:phosphoribosylaminoimidazolecarboxamide formyltransferase/IMP cyclohydrolase
VSDGIIAPGYEPEALAILKAKKKGGYNVVADRSGLPARSHRAEAGVRRDLRAGPQRARDQCETMLQTSSPKTMALTEDQKRDLVMSLIALKYTQSNSVCYVQDGQTIGVGAGQQSRIHCTRLAGQQGRQLAAAPHAAGAGSAVPRRRGQAQDRDNAIDVYIGDTPEDVIGEGVWARPLRNSRTSDEAVRKKAGSQRSRRLPRQRRLLPVRRQHRARAPQRRQRHCAAGRLHPR